MADRAIILFGKPNLVGRAKRNDGPEKFHRPLHLRQVSRLALQLKALQSAVVTLKQIPAGIESEKTLVFEVQGRSYSNEKSLCSPYYEADSMDK
jgi:hypothetical protein